MRRLYEKNEVLFAVGWILVYCLIMAPLRGEFGDGSLQCLLATSVYALCIILFVRTNNLEDKYGLNRGPKNLKKCLYFIPMWILATGNIWDGFSLSYTGVSLLYATIVMALIGFIEEMLFRGFLFKAMIPENGIVPSIIVSSLTFGIGHIVNLISGQASFETIVQIVFAISWGFLFTMVYYRGESLIPCIIAHSMIDVLSLYGADTLTGDWIYICTTIVVSILYCIYLCRIKTDQ